MKELPVRKRIRLKDYNYSNTGNYFVTVCVKDRHELLGKIVGNAVVGNAVVGNAVVGDAVPSVPCICLREIGEIVQSYLAQMNAIMEYEALENYTVMPNHVHLLITIRDGMLRTASPTNAVIPRIVHGMKTVTTKQIGYSIWQRAYHDHIIRDETEYHHIWQYIDKNHARWTEDIYYVPVAASK